MLFGAGEEPFVGEAPFAGEEPFVVACADRLLSGWIAAGLALSLGLVLLLPVPADDAAFLEVDLLLFCS